MKGNQVQPVGFVAVPYISLCNANVIVDAPDDEYVQVDRHFFRFCLRTIIDQIRLDEAWYLNRYPDIAAAIARGDIPNARAHYARHGYFENRMPYPIEVDKAWYLAQYLDVDEAITRKDYPSAQAHFDEVGFSEGRLPYPRFTLALEVTEEDNPPASLRVVRTRG